MLKSRLPEAGANLFQAVKAQCVEAEAKGIKLLKLTIGEPDGRALLSARQFAADAIMHGSTDVHGYQDNGCRPCEDFAERFVWANNPQADFPGRDVSYLPIPGIKPMLGLIPLACGAQGSKPIDVATTTKPGYPTPADWCRYLIGAVTLREFELNPNNEFRFGFGGDGRGWPPDLIMMNYPHNPTGQVASREWLMELCDWCQEHNVRLFNDAAYAVLAFPGSDHVTLAEIAVQFPGLSWAEAYSASKAGNFCGWRVGAIVGSPDFVADIAKIKGNSDSGFNAALALGVLHAFENDFESISKVRGIYQRRIVKVRAMLEAAGLKLAVEPKAGFFTLWRVPTTAFGLTVKDAGHFNQLMIERVGLAGVPFNPSYIRYAVCNPLVDDNQLIAELASFLAEAKIGY